MSTIRRDIVYTLIGQGVVAMALLIQYRIVSNSWGLVALSSFSLLYRVRGAIEWIVLLLLPLAIARQVSAEESREARTGVASVGLVLGLLCLCVACSLMLASPRFAATVLFGGDRYSDWVAPFCSLLAGYSLALLANGILRGLFAFKAANVANVVSIAIIPTACLIAGQGHDILQVVSIMGIGSGCSTLCFLAVFVWRHRRSNLVLPISLTGATIAGSVKSLLTFGGARMTTVGLSALFAMAVPWLLARHGLPEVLATLNVMMAILAGAAVMTSPVGFVLLPHFSRSLAAGERNQAAQNLRSIVSAAIYVGIVASIATMGFAADILRVLFERELPGQTPLIAAVAISVPLFLVVDISRSPLDAISTYPLNAVTYLAGFVGAIAVFHVPWLIAPGLEPWRCGAALVAGYLVAASVCSTLLGASYGIAIISRADLVLLCIWVLSTVGWIALSMQFGATMLVTRCGALLALGACATYLYAFKPPWFTQLRRRNAT